MNSLFSMTRRHLLAMAISTVGIVAAAAPATAQTPDALKTAGKVRIGMLVDFPPYGILNENNEPDGYDADVAKLFAERLGVPIEIVQLTGPNRIPNLLTGRIDIVIGSLTITPERAKQVQFSSPYSVAPTVIIGVRDLKAEKLEDLSGVSVAVPRAGSQDLVLTKSAPKDTQIQRFDDDASASQALLSGQVQTLAASMSVVAQIQKASPAGTFEVKFPLYTSLFGMAMRPGEEELLTWSNAFIAENIANGKLSELNKKWFGEDLPAMEIPDYITK